MAETFRVSSPGGMAGQGAQDTHCPPGRIPKTGASLGWRGSYFRPACGSSCFRKWGGGGARRYRYRVLRAQVMAPSVTRNGYSPCDIRVTSEDPESGPHWLYPLTSQRAPSVGMAWADGRCPAVLRSHPGLGPGQ